MYVWNIIDAYVSNIIMLIKPENTIHVPNVLFPKDGMLTSSSKIFIFFSCRSFIILTLFRHPFLLLYTYYPTPSPLHHPLFTVLLKFNAFSTLLLWHSNWVDTHICPPLRHSWTCFKVPCTLGPLIVCQAWDINVLHTIFVVYSSLTYYIYIYIYIYI